MNTIHTLYNSLLFNKQKDKLDMILEPFQSMVQLALLSLSPIGTKLKIQENILYLNPPTIIQPITRWLNSDKKDDLFFLFQVIKRFIKWYNPAINKDSILTIELYQLINKMAIAGLNNLIKTYSSFDSSTVVQVICMYKDLLERNEDFNYEEEKQPNQVNMDEVFINVIKIYDINILNVIYNMLILMGRHDNMIDNSNMIDGLNLLSISYF